MQCSQIEFWNIEVDFVWKLSKIINFNFKLLEKCSWRANICVYPTNERMMKLNATCNSVKKLRILFDRWTKGEEQKLNSFPF